MARGRPTPFKVISALRLRKVPVNPVRRLLAMPVTDYEIIVAQHVEIMRLRWGGRDG